MQTRNLASSSPTQICHRIAPSLIFVTIRPKCQKLGGLDQHSVYRSKGAFYEIERRVHGMHGNPGIDNLGMGVADSKVSFEPRQNLAGGKRLSAKATKPTNAKQAAKTTKPKATRSGSKAEKVI